MVGGENAHHDAPRLAFQDPDVIADVGHEVAGLMRDAVAFHVTGQARAVNLAAHDLQHLAAGGLADGFALLHHLEQLAHIARRAQAEGGLGLAVKRLGIGRGA